MDRWERAKLAAYLISLRTANILLGASRAAVMRMTDPDPAPAIAANRMTAREANYALDQADHLERLNLERLAGPRGVL